MRVYPYILARAYPLLPTDWFGDIYMHKACRNCAHLLAFRHIARNSPKTQRPHTPNYWVMSTSLGYFSPGIVAMTVFVLASMTESVLP